MAATRRQQPVRSQFKNTIVSCSVIWAIVLFSVGCDEGASTGTSPSSPRSPTARQTESVVDATNGEQASTREKDSDSSSDQKWRRVGDITETWDVVYVKNSRIGYFHSKKSDVKLKDSDELFVHTEVEQNMTIKRFGQKTSQSILLSSVETKAGKIIEYTTEYKAGPQAITATGEYDGGQMVVTTKSLGKNEKSFIPWEEDAGGFFAIEQSLERQSLKPGEKRTVRALQPILNQVADVQLQAADYEETKMLAGSQRLLKVDVTTKISGQEIEQTLWIDDSGEALKSDMPSLGFVTYRTTKDIALQKVDKIDFDLGEMSVVRVRGRLDKPHETQRITYRAHLKDGKIAGVFPDCGSQSVRTIDHHTAEIVVHSIRPDKPKTMKVKDAAPTDDELKPNSLIQSDNELIVKMASDVAAKETDQWAVACALESYVRTKIKNVNFSQAFATAAEVAQTLEGDCTEHAVLLAALCRVRKIPSRVAMGLVYFPSSPSDGFAYHMWTEVWMKDRWVPLDATLDKGGIGAAHIKLADSNLKGASAYSAFLPVIEVIGQLELEILEVEP